MNDFMFVFRNAPMPAGFQPSPEAMQAEMQKWIQWFEQLGKNGKLGNPGEQLIPHGAVVRGSKKAVTDGPYAEGKEVVGGFILIKAADLKEATELAKGCPIFAFEGSVEVRQVLKVG